MSKVNKDAWASRLTKQQIFTIPNILSFLRLALIPLIIYLYVFANSPEWTMVVLIFSGITDIADGIIARKFDMITDFGKALDPVADKVTQGAVLLCLLTRFPLMWIPLVLLIVKETVAFTMRLILFNKTEKVIGAKWHGKLNTVVLYLIMAVHIIWYNIPPVVSTVSITVSSILTVISFVLYTVSIAFALSKAIRKESEEKLKDNEEVKKSA